MSVPSKETDLDKGEITFDSRHQGSLGDIDALLDEAVEEVFGTRPASVVLPPEERWKQRALAAAKICGRVPLGAMLARNSK